MKYMSLGVLVLVSAAAVGAQAPAPKSDDKVAKDSMTVTGCVGAGTEANTFILTKARSAAAAAAAAPTTPPAEAATAADPVIYRLDSPEKVKAHLGHQVEVTGTLDETTATDAKEATPSTDAAKTAGTSGKQPSLKLKVKEVKMLSATCS
jgi:cytoskeletal protein RodZ